MDKYFPEISDDGLCLELCQVNPDRHIGSLACKQRCEHCRNSGVYDNKLWIECDLLGQALGAQIIDEVKPKSKFIVPLDLLKEIEV